MPKISPLADVSPQACIADDVEIGPFCVVGPHVTLGAGNRLLSHVVITGHTTIGTGNVFHPHCVIGGTPQDLKYAGEPTRLEIGSRNVIREAVTIHIGTEKGGRIYGGGVTRVGDENLLMVNCHIGHDCQFGNRCILANNVMVAGHVICGNNVNMMGLVGIHHLVTIGDFAYLAGAARIHHDVPPFVKVADDDQVRGLNSVGLQRAGYSEPDIAALERAARKLFYNREKPFSRVLGEFDSMDRNGGSNGNGTTNSLNPHVKQLIDFLRRRDQGKHGRFLESLR